MGNVFTNEAYAKGNQPPQHHVETQVLTLSYIQTNEYQFSIPSYQRPYVWPDEAVLKLFKDINDARVAKEPNYFIGTVLTSIEQDEDGNGIYELIDGQQRTTTLMLIALAFKMVKVDSAIADTAAFKKQPRLQFTIRDQVQHLLGSLAGLDEYVFPGLEAIGENPYLKRIYAALQVLEQQVKALKYEDRILLGDYIFNHVQWVNNIVPQQMDLNRLFATMNTAGVQLEQADILKSKLLKQISNDKPLFDAMWLACEHMENYFERNVRKVFPNAPWNDIKAEHLAFFDEKLFVKNSGSTVHKKGLTIMQLAEQLKAGAESSSDEGKDNKLDNEQDAGSYDLEAETVYCRPIISFPLLLIHAYRIYLANRAVELGDGTDDVIPRVHADKLLETFEPLTKASEEEVKEFIKTLWQVRYQFDRWVVKWVERDDSDDEQLRLTYLTRSESSGKWYINRTQKELNELVMLQSVRNFTGERSAQYWITPFIAGLIKENITEDAQAIALLEKVDNDLSLAAESETQKTASFKQAKQQQPEVNSWQTNADYFTEARGTSFEHYWFQKLEYILWKQEADRHLEQFKNYRITAKNSVEHVYPQHGEYQNVLERDFLDAFGNLVLLSPGENSSYSNQAVKKKLVDFEAKPQYDSLKLKAMFKLLKEQNEWQETQIRQHQKEMLSALAAHYGDKE
ncbi:DUF262 domain-containing protein [Pseudoalteromonas piratica]|uniref:DUF262 domain-containing protein n=1 Tax=Pseudoalteromonas piratica TaxID=1348114 RepID=UPI0006908F7F|nr:DUF262 domain-containing protein [Pseudoalteromonas piratica]